MGLCKVAGWVSIRLAGWSLLGGWGGWSEAARLMEERGGFVQRDWERCGRYSRNL